MHTIGCVGGLAKETTGTEMVAWEGQNIQGRTKLKTWQKKNPKTKHKKTWPCLGLI